MQSLTLCATLGLPTRRTKMFSVMIEAAENGAVATLASGLERDRAFEIAYAVMNRDHEGLFRSTFVMRDGEPVAEIKPFNCVAGA